MKRSIVLILSCVVVGCSPATNTAGDGATPGADMTNGGGDLTMSVTDAAPAADLTMAPAASAFAGYWQVTALDLPNPGSPVAMLTRASAPVRELSDYTITATDVTHLGVAGKLALIQAASLVTLGPTSTMVTIDGAKWLTTNGNSAAVYDYTLAGDDLTVRFDDADPRTTGDNTHTPRRLVMHRMAAPPSVLVGHWKVTTLTQQGVSVVAGVCVPMGNTSSRLDIGLDIDARHVLAEVVTQSSFSDGNCMTASGVPSTQRVEGIAEEAPGTVETFSRNAGGGAELDAQWTVSMPMAGQLVLTQVHCAPMANCTNAPTKIVLQAN